MALSLEHDRAILFERRSQFVITETNGSPYSIVTGSAIYPRVNEDRCKAKHTCRCNCSWWRGRYHYLFRQDESLINGRLIGFLDGGVITSKRSLVHVDRKGSERYKTYRVSQYIEYLSISSLLIIKSLISREFLF